jgi:hypothetical protein
MLMEITFGDGYSVMQQSFTFQGGIVITSEYGDQKTLTPFEKSKGIVHKAYVWCTLSRTRKEALVEFVSHSCSVDSTGNKTF